MKSIYVCLISVVLVASSLCARAQTNDLNLNGMAAFEQLRKEYYIGALYLGWPGRDPAAIANMPGKKRIQINVTADRWPSLRFSQMWNQAITINNSGAVINANALDILAFTSLPKGDLVEGDELTIELTNNNTTLVSIDGLAALHTKNSALFTMLLDAWIGPRPPTSEFKRDILDLPKDQAGNDLVARFKSIHPSEARKKVIASWGYKTEPETLAVAAAATTAVTATAAVEKKPEATAAVKAEASAKSVAETKSTAEVKSKPAAKPAATAAGTAKVASATPAKPIVPVQPDAQAIAAKAAHDHEQETLSNDYFSIVRKEVIRNIQYPRRAAQDNIEGLVMARIKIDHRGDLSSIEIAQSANDLLDHEVERAVKRAAPFPKAPDSLEGNSFEYLVPIVFKLRQ